jgi:hypothetical protein
MLLLTLALRYIQQERPGLVMKAVGRLAEASR